MVPSENCCDLQWPAGGDRHQEIVLRGPMREHHRCLKRWNIRLVSVHCSVMARMHKGSNTQTLPTVSFPGQKKLPEASLMV